VLVAVGAGRGIAAARLGWSGRPLDCLALGFVAPMNPLIHPGNRMQDHFELARHRSFLHARSLWLSNVKRSIAILSLFSLSQDKAHCQCDRQYANEPNDSWK
jgi:hypothetical protein